MDVTSLHTNILQEEGIQTVCEACDAFYKDTPPIPTRLLAQALRLILQENSFQFCGKNYLQTHGTAMGTKMAVAFANIFMGKVETEILSQSALKPLTWKRYIDDIFSLWDTSREDLTHFIEQANKHHPTILFTAEISDTETTFLDTSVYKGERFTNESVLDIRTHYKPTETFQYTHFSSKKSNSSNLISLIEVTQRVLSKELSRKLILKIESRPYYLNLKQTRKSCLLLRNITQQYQT